MTLLNTANKIYLGSSLASKVYAGATQVWPPVSAFEAETTAWETAVVAAGGSVSSGRKTTVDTLIKDLKTAGVWAKLERLWLFAGENSQSALRDVATASAATLTNAPSFTTDRGYTGNGTNASINSGFNLSTGTKFVQDSACFFAWSNTSGADDTPIAGIVDDRNSIYPAYGSDIYAAVNSSLNRNTTSPGTDGLFCVTRPDASNVRLYRNGSLVFDLADTSTTPVNANLQFLTNVGLWSSRQLSCGGAGQHLTATDQTNLYNKLRTYMTAVGVP